MKKIINKIIWTGLFLIPNWAFGAMENNYPPIPVSFTKTLVINEGSSTTDALIYFYALFLAIATIIAVMVIVWAGLEMIMSSGEAGKISSARNRGVGALIGLGVILGSYIILNTISPSLSSPSISGLNCDKSNFCIEIHKDVGGTDKVTYVDSLDDGKDLGLVGNDKIVIKRYVGLKEIWGFDYNGNAQRIGGYQDTDTTNLLNELSTELTIDSSYKSIKIYTKQLGAYLYDSPGFNVSKLPPLFTGKSLGDLGEYKGKIKSIQFLNDADSKYYAVLFSLNDYNKNYDYNFLESTGGPSCSEILIDDKANSISFSSGSILLFKSKTDFLAQPVSGLTFYDILNCDIGATINACPVNPGPLFESQALSCGFNAGDVLSVRVTKQAGVLMFVGSNKKSCKFFDISSPSRVYGDCISNDILFSRKIIDNFIVIPYENKL
jgi:hypothetical protein